MNVKLTGYANDYVAKVRILRFVIVLALTCSTYRVWRVEPSQSPLLELMTSPVPVDRMVKALPSIGTVFRCLQFYMR